MFVYLFSPKYGGFLQIGPSLKCEILLHAWSKLPHNLTCPYQGVESPTSICHGTYKQYKHVSTQIRPKSIWLWIKHLCSEHQHSLQMDVPPHSHWKILDSYHHSAVTSVPSLFLEPLPEAPKPGMGCWSVVLSPLCGWIFTHHMSTLDLQPGSSCRFRAPSVASFDSTLAQKNTELARSAGFKHLSSALFHFPWEADFSIDFLRGSRGNWSARESWCMHHQDIIDIQNVKQQPGLSWDLDWWTMWTSTVSKYQQW